jgi:hypothetical protein
MLMISLAVVGIALAVYIVYTIMRVVFLCVLAAGVAIGIESANKEKVSTNNVIEGHFTRVR